MLAAVESYEFAVPDSLDGARLDKALTELVPGASRASVKKAIEAGHVRLNGRRAAKGAQVKAGDSLSLPSADLGARDGPAMASPEAPLTIRFETAKVLVADKPAGQPTAPLKADEIGTLVNALVGHHPELAAPDLLAIGYSPREPGLLHRLDNDTSGLLVVARTAAAFISLKEALLADRIAKSYLLVCREEGLPDDGSIAFPIANHPKDKRRVYACVHPRDVMRYAPRPATTEYRVLERRAGWARVEVSVARALRHQIRVHFAAIDHPLAGDLLYGGEAVAGLERHALHASRVALEDSDPELTFDVTSPLPSELEQLFG